jgi:hypothetical protein
MPIAAEDPASTTEPPGEAAGETPVYKDKSICYNSLRENRISGLLTASLFILKKY